MPQTSDPKSSPPANLFFGKVMHARMKPVTHRFSYRIFSLLIDIDKLDGAHNQNWFFSINKRNIVSFHERDHGTNDGSPLKPQIERLLVRNGLEIPSKVLLWCNPRVFGYTFNPLSVYFCYNDQDEVFALVYQVHNTFGEAHSYVATVDDKTKDKHGSIRQSVDKCFYVSPFLDMDLRYDFRVNPPGDELKIRILEHDAKGPILAAVFSGIRKPINTANLFLGIVKTAGLTWKITTGIHYEALLLWFKGMTIRPRPAPPRQASHVKQGE